MLDQTELISLNKGDILDHYLMIRKSETRLTKNGKEFIILELGDKSRSISANLWDDSPSFKSLKNSLETGIIVKVNGTIDEYQGTPQVKIESLRHIKESEKISPKDFLPQSRRNMKVMKDEFFLRISKIHNEQLNNLLTNIFNDERFEKYSSVPAGKMWHHGYIGGLLEHTLEIIRICDLMCDIHPEINRDLLISGAMLHDFGKVEELSYDPVFEYTDKGKLLGHIVIASMMVKAEIDKIADFPEKLEQNLLHLILSHQGKLEYASPVVPKTLEAIALYQADELSAKVNAYKNVILNETKDENPWTRFISLAGTDLYNHGLPNAYSEKNNKTLFD